MFRSAMGWQALRSPSFRLLFVGQIVSQAGDYILYIALPVWLYSLTGSPAAAGSIFLALTLPQLLVSPFAGVFVDRWDRRRTMLTMDLLRALLVAGLFLVRSVESAWLIFVLAFAISCASRFFMPARSALLPRLVPREHLGPANAAISFSDAVARLSGPALGGVLVTLWGAHAAAAVDAATFLLSALAIWAMRVPSAASHPQAAERPVNEQTGCGCRYCIAALAAPTARGPLATFLRDLREGVAVVGRRPALRDVFGIVAAFSLGQGIISALLVALVTRVWRGDPSQVMGWLTSGQGLGALAGGLLVGVLAARVAPRLLLTVGSVGIGALIFVLANQPSAGVGIAIYTAIGVLAVALQVGASTLFQLETDSSHRGRVSSLLSTVGAAATVASMAAGTVLVDRIGVVRLFDLATLAMVLGGLLVAPAPFRVQDLTRIAFRRAQ